MSDLHFVYENDKVYAVREGKVVASADNLSALHESAYSLNPGDQVTHFFEPERGTGQVTEPYGSWYRVQWPDGRSDLHLPAELNGPEAAQGGAPVEGVPAEMPRAASDKTSFDDHTMMHRDLADRSDAAGDLATTCPQCGHQGVDYDVPGGGYPACLNCGHDSNERDEMYGLEPGYELTPYHNQPLASTHIVTPGGMKGKVLGKVRDIWGEQVTVRLENGRIAHLRVTEDTKFSIEKASSVTKTAAQSLTDELEAPFGSDRASITARLKTLEGIRERAVAAHRTASFEDSQTLDGIIVTADAERLTLRQALDAIEAQEAERHAYKPLEYTAGPVSESLGGSDSSWLNTTVDDMIAEAEGRDFDKLVSEEPALFVSDLSDGTVADMGSTRDMALAHVRSKTAGIDPERAEEIQRQFLANVEAARREELTTRKETVRKEASAAEQRVIDLPDDYLW